MVNYVLVLGAAGSGKLRVARSIDQSSFSNLDISSESHSGLILRASLSTKYYNCKLSLLIDEFPENRDTTDVDESEKLAAFERWIEEFASPECAEVREAIEGVMFCVNVKDSIQYVNKALEKLERVRELVGDGFLCVIGTKDSATEKSDAVKSEAEKMKNDEIEDIVISYGMEYIDWSLDGYNEFSERIGKGRVEEILQTHEWNQRELVHNYDKSKREKAQEMSQGLLDEYKDGENENNLDIDEIFQKLQLAKENVSQLSADQREAYVNKVIEEVIDFI